jgi:hypothetical protein
MRSCPSDPDGQKLKLALLQKRKAKKGLKERCIQDARNMELVTTL